MASGVGMNTEKATSKREKELAFLVWEKAKVNSLFSSKCLQPVNSKEFPSWLDGSLSAPGTPSGLDQCRPCVHCRSLWVCAHHPCWVQKDLFPWCLLSPRALTQSSLSSWEKRLMEKPQLGLSFPRSPILCTMSSCICPYLLQEASVMTAEQQDTDLWILPSGTKSCFTSIFH